MYSSFYFKLCVNSIMIHGYSFKPIIHDNDNFDVKTEKEEKSQIIIL